MTGAMSARMALIKASPRGCMRAPKSGYTWPRTIPTTMASRTCTQSCRCQAFGWPLFSSPVTGAAIAIVCSLLQPAPSSYLDRLSIRVDWGSDTAKFVEPRGIIVKNFLLNFRLGSKERNEVDQVAVIRHDLHIRMWPVRAPQHPISGRFDQFSGKRHSILERRTRG